MMFSFRNFELESLTDFYCKLGIKLTFEPPPIPPLKPYPTLSNPTQPYPTLPNPTQPYPTLPNLTQPPFPPPELNWQGVYFSSSLWQRCLKLHCLLASLANKWWTNFESEYTLGREHVGASGRLPVREGSSLRPLSASRFAAFGFMNSQVSFLFILSKFNIYIIKYTPLII